MDTLVTAILVFGAWEKAPYAAKRNAPVRSVAVVFVLMIMWFCSVVGLWLLEMVADIDVVWY